MVKLFYISVLFKNENNRVTNLKSAAELSSFGYFQRNRYSSEPFVYLIIYLFFPLIIANSVLEFMRFTSKICVERSEKATRSSVKQQGLSFHSHIVLRFSALTFN